MVQVIILIGILHGKFELTFGIKYIERIIYL
jgi:hypothetical protein